MKQATTKMMFSSASPEWYTPAWLFDRLRDFLGGDLFDPCPAPEEGTPFRDAFSYAWHGRIYLNPPYGRHIGKWVEKLLNDPVDEAVLLLPARTDTRWFQPLYRHTLCFIRGRIKFDGPDGRGVGAPFPSVLVYVGPRRRAFYETFNDLGPMVEALQPEQVCGPLISVTREQGATWRH